MNKKINYYIAFVTLFTIIFAYFVACYQFGGYDLSPLVDLQYRIFQKQTPGEDFVYTFPFVIAIAIKIQLILSGPNWFSLIWINSVFYALSVFFLYSYWPQNFNKERLLQSVILLSLPVIYTNHFWHSSVTQYISIVYITIIHYILVNKCSLLSKEFALLFTTSGLLFFSKQNLGAPLILATGLTLVFSQISNDEYRATIVKMVLVALLGILSFLALAIALLNCSLFDILNSFIFVIDRKEITREQADAMTFKPLFIKGIVIFTIIYIVQSIRANKDFVKDNGLYAAAGVLLIGFFSYMKNHDGIVASSLVVILVIYLKTFRVPMRHEHIKVAIFASALLISLIPMATDWDSKYNNVSLTAVCLIILIPNTITARSRFIIWGCVLFLLIGAINGGINRQRMHDVGEEYYWEDKELTVINDGYFKGLKVGPNMHDLRSELFEVLKKHPDSTRIFCGPRIEFCYADNHLKSPTGLPLWWHPGSSYPMVLESELVNQFKRNDFQILFFAHDQYIRMPDQLLQYLESNFHLIHESNVLDVYQNNGY